MLGAVDVREEGQPLLARKVRLDGAEARVGGELFGGLMERVLLGGSGDLLLALLLARELDHLVVQRRLVRELRRVLRL